MRSQSRKPKLLVTGGAGFIGSNFVELAIHQGYSVVVLDLLSYAGYRENLSAWENSDDFTFVLGDIADHNIVLSIFKKYEIQAVLNFAAESHVDRSISGPREFIQTNIVGTYNLLRCALQYWEELPIEKKDRFRFLQVSTDEVFGSLGKEGKFNESSPLEPNSPYSASKASADHLVRAWHHTFGLPTITTRCSNNYGPRQFPEKLIPVVILNALSGNSIPVYGDGSNVRDWIYVMDHCKALLLALKNANPGSTYCFGGNAEVSNLDLVRMICQKLDQLQPQSNSYENQIQFVEDRLGHDWRYAIDDHLAQKELGFKREVQLEEGLDRTLRWYLENQDWCSKILQKSTRRK